MQRSEVGKRSYTPTCLVASVHGSWNCRGPWLSHGAAQGQESQDQDQATTFPTRAQPQRTSSGIWKVNQGIKKRCIWNAARRLSICTPYCTGPCMYPNRDQKPSKVIIKYYHNAVVRAPKGRWYIYPSYTSLGSWSPGQDRTEQGKAEQGLALERHQKWGRYILLLIFLEPATTYILHIYLPS